MKNRNKIVAGISASAIALTSLISAPAYAMHAVGNHSLASYLNTENQAFDRNWSDFDILSAVINDVLAVPRVDDPITVDVDESISPLAVLTDCSVDLTAFLPTDRAFRKLIKETNGKMLKYEANVATSVLQLGTARLEQILLYHVLLGTPVDKATAMTWPAGQQLVTAEGSLITVRVGTALILRDESVKNLNPKVILNRMDLNAGNNQPAHAINRVLLPLP